LSTLKYEIHPRAEEELIALATSGDPEKEFAAAQLIWLLDLVRSHTDIRDRLLTHYQTITVRIEEGEWQQLDIKLIQQLKDIAEDGRYHTDAVRRIRDLTQSPANEYRIFFAPRKPWHGSFTFQVLGVFERTAAYTDETLAELKKRYESSL